MREVGFRGIAVEPLTSDQSMIVGFNDGAGIDGTAILYVDLIPSSLALFGRLCAVATPLRVGMF
jgi:hypothetical protein